MTNPFSYEGKRVVITGAYSGVGAALLELVAELGAAHITVLDVKEPSGPATTFRQTDLSSQAEVDAAVVEAGLGGRLDATNVLDAPVVVLTNVALEHTDVLGATRNDIAAEKLAVVEPGALVVLGESEWEDAARAAGAAAVTVVAGSSGVLAHAAVESLLGRTVDPAPLEGVIVPGRLERVGEAPLEVWDGAHNLAGVGYLLTRVPSADWVLVVSILEDKHAHEMLAALSALGRRLVATSSSSARALPPNRLAEIEAATTDNFDRLFARA